MITVRYRDDIEETMRVVHEHRAFDITGVLRDPDSGHEWIDLPCKSGLTEG